MDERNPNPDSPIKNLIQTIARAYSFISLLYTIIFYNITPKAVFLDKKNYKQSPEYACFLSGYPKWLFNLGGFFVFDFVFLSHCIFRYEPTLWIVRKRKSIKSIWKDIQNELL